MLSKMLFVASLALAAAGALAAGDWQEAADGTRRLVLAGNATLGSMTTPASVEFLTSGDQPREKISGVVSVRLVVDNPHPEGFSFDDFEGPDAPVRGRTLLHARVVGPGRPAEFALTVSGSYVDGGSGPGFAFESSALARVAQSRQRQLFGALAGGGEELELSVTDSRDGQRKLRLVVSVAGLQERFKALLQAAGELRPGPGRGR